MKAILDENTRRNEKLTEDTVTPSRSIAFFQFNGLYF